MKNLLDKIETLIKSGELLQAVILDQDGLLVESRGTVYDPYLLAAAISPLFRFSRSFCDELRLDSVAEISIKPNGKPQNIIWRNFVYFGQPMTMIMIFRA